jgi:hypothetical protein
LLHFDPPAMVARLVRKYRDAGLAGVMSSDEYVGAAMAAAVARELRLPHADPAHIVTAQHKLASRRLQKQAVPEAVPDFALVRLATATPEPALPYPFFVKPVKGTFSLFAKRVPDQAALKAHLRFKPWERFALGRITAPFDRGPGSRVDFTHGVFSSPESKAQHMQGWMMCFAMLGKVLDAQS